MRLSACVVAVFVFSCRVIGLQPSCSYPRPVHRPANFERAREYSPGPEARDFSLVLSSHPPLQVLADIMQSTARVFGDVDRTEPSPALDVGEKSQSRGFLRMLHYWQIAFASNIRYYNFRGCSCPGHCRSSMQTICATRMLW